MKIFKFRKIQRRLLFWFILLALVPLSISILISYFIQVEEIKQEVIKKLTITRNLKVNILNNWLNEKEGDLRGISNFLSTQDIKNLFHSEEITEKDIAAINRIRDSFNIYMEDYFDYEEIFIIHVHSSIVEISTNKSREGRNALKEDYFIMPLESRDFYIKDVFFGPILNKLTMAFSFPIFSSIYPDEEREVIGVLVALVNLDNSFFPLIQDTTGLGTTGEILIVNKDLVAINELRWEENSALKLRIEAEPARLATQGSTGILESVDYRGEKVLAAHTYIPKTGWGLVVKRDLAEIYAPIRRTAYDLILLLIITAGAIYLASGLLAGSISKPLLSIVKVLKRVQEGDLSIRNNIKIDDEIGYLAEAYNKMADSIQSKLKLEHHQTEISKIIISLLSLKDFAKGIIGKLMEITDSNMGVFYLLNEEEFRFEHVASLGIDATLVKFFNAQYPEGEFGRAITEKKISHIRNIPPETIFRFKTITGTAIPKEIVTVPLIVDEQVVAIISLASLFPFTSESLEVIENSFNILNIAISNLLASERKAILTAEIEDKNVKLQKLADELQQQSEELQAQSDELQQQNIELNMQKKQVEEANRLKSEFLSNMSHELRTPLNSIMALSRTLIMQAKNKISSEEHRYLEIIERNGKNLLTLINDILDLSKIEAGKMDIFVQTFSVNSLIFDIKENCLPLLEKSGVKMNIKIPDNLPMIENDQDKVRKVLQNIIGNSVKFTVKGSINIKVDFDEKQVIINVADTGIAISKEELPYIFDEFKQVDSSVSRRFEGTGLGLAIVRKLLDRLGGKIEVQSELGKGSVFIVYLPLKWSGHIESEEASGLLTDVVIEQTPDIGKDELIDENNKIEKEKNKEKTRILVVEDHKEAVIQIRTILEHEGYIVDDVNSGQAALSYIKHTIPDGIILDLMMPEIDGFEVLEKLRGTERTANIPVLILTAKDLTKEDFKKLSANHIQQLLYKGAVEKRELLFKVKLMLKNNIETWKKIKGGKQEKIFSEKKIKHSQVKILKKREELPTILVAEDNPDNMLTVKAILKDKYNLIEAIDGELALNNARSHLLDLILMDISLPKIDGLTVVKYLKENKNTQNIPVIAVTARAMKGDKEKIIRAGCDDYISKPVDPEVMLRKIAELVKEKENQ